VVQSSIKLTGAIMSLDTVISVAINTKSGNDLVERGFTRQPLRIDVDIARALEELAHAAWSIPKDKYYEGGDRYRSLNRVRAEIVDGGVKVWPSEESTPYEQLEKYNPTLGGRPREYTPLPTEIAASIGVRKMIAHHLHYLPLSKVGARYLVNVHLIRFAATPGRPCDTSPPGLHKDGEKYLATHLVGRCGADGGEVVIIDNDKHELDRFTMRECGECYVFDDERIWHMLTPVAVMEGNQYAYRDTLAFDMLPEGWEPVK
ncbi:MAG: 2OG-Fe dioxygenase family protein, partial [Candidatus Sulfotelmatobacter sp.]